MKSSRVAAIAAGVSAGLCLLYALVSGFVSLILQPAELMPISFDVTVMIVLASVGIVSFILFLVLRHVLEKH